jgi:hypothetical protein
MASNESNDTTRHMAHDSLTTKHTSDWVQRTQTTAHIENKLGATQTQAQNQGSTPAPANSSSTSSGSSSGQGSGKSTE